MSRQDKNIPTSLKYRFYAFLYNERETSLNLSFLVLTIILKNIGCFELY